MFLKVLSSEHGEGEGQGSIRKGWGGLGPKIFVYQKWPDKIFPTVNFVSSHDGPFGRGGVGVCLKGRALWGPTQSSYKAVGAHCKIGWGGSHWRLEKRGGGYWGCGHAFGL